MARLRNGPASRPMVQAPSSTRRALKEKTNTTQPPAPSYDNDGNTEGLVKDAKPGRGRGRPRKVQQDSDDLVMAGGLGDSDEMSVQPTSEPPTTTDELAKSDSVPMPQTKANKRPPRTVRKIAQSQTQSKVLEGLKQRMEATARGQRAKPTSTAAASDTIQVSSDAHITHDADSVEAAEKAVERSGLTLSPSHPRPGKLSAARANRLSLAQPGSALKIQGTPAVESSILALKNFKRRPRQMSMLSMVQQRTASARPSISHDPVAADDSSAFDFDLDGDEEDDFAPDAEGTPLNAEKRKRKSTEVGDVPVTESSTRSKRRKSAARTVSQQAAVMSSPGDTIQVRSRATDPVEEPLSSSPLRSVADLSVPGISEAEHAQLDNDEIEVPSTEPERGAVERAASVDSVDDSDIDVANGTMADPASSSPAPNIKSRLDPDMADPATQASPAASRPQRAKKQKPISTATLQSLLPKRRKPLGPRQKKTEYDMESESSEEEIVLDTSHLEDDEDELGGGLRKRTKSAASKIRKSATAKKVPQVPTKSNRSKRKTAVAAPATGGAKTYARTTASDKENDGYESFEEADESTLPEVSVSMQELAHSRELEEAKRKFAEVDDWDMEFESMSQDEHRRSSQSWR